VHERESHILVQDYNHFDWVFSQGNFDWCPVGLIGFSDLLILARNYNGSLSADFARAPGAASGPGRTVASPARSMQGTLGDTTARGEFVSGSRNAFAGGSVIGADRSIGSGLDRRDEPILA
jgi:hypothetical protein